MTNLISSLPTLRRSANEAMWKAWHGAGLHIGTPGEVACIRNLVEIGLPAIDTMWQTTFANLNIKARLRGVVCHGHPWVMYSGAARRCELGDFLLVHDHRPPTGKMERRAVIVQAKVFHIGGVRAKNHTQLYLYQNWPCFKYDSWPGGISALASIHASAGLGDPLPLLRERNLSAAGAAILDDGCRYGMIDAEYSRWGDPKKSMNPWRLCSAMVSDVYTSKAGLSLGSYIVRFMAGDVGRETSENNWPKKVVGACHWSLMVKELLSLLPNTALSSSKLYLAATPNLGLQASSPNAQSVGPSSDVGEGGFGVIQIETSGDLTRSHTDG